MSQQDPVWSLPATVGLSLLAGTLLALTAREQGLLPAVVLGVVFALVIFGVITLVRAGQRGR